MTGLKFDFDIGDIVIDVDKGRFVTANIDNQNVALISLSQICRLTRPELGAQIGARLLNRKPVSVSAVLVDAERQAKADGATNVFVGFSDSNALTFRGKYED